MVNDQKILGWLVGQVLEVMYKVGRDSWGVVEHPYRSWKQLVRERDWRPAVVLLGLFSGYFWIRVPIREGWPGSLIAWGVKGFAGAMIYGLTYLGVTGWFWVVGKLWGKKVDYRVIFCCWIYSYWPTAIWFGVTALLFYLLPPPRGQGLLGYMFSGVFVAMTVGLAMWKGLLYYLTMRMAVGLSPKEMGWASLVVLAGLGVLGGWGYGVGWWRVPFI
jgi:hypothetical protein